MRDAIERTRLERRIALVIFALLCGLAVLAGALVASPPEEHSEPPSVVRVQP